MSRMGQLISKPTNHATNELTKADILNSMRSGNLARLEQLKNCTPDFCETTYNGKSLLHMAVIHNQPKCLQFFLDCGIDVNICDSVQNTPLMEIVQCESRDASELQQIIRMLLSAKANIDAANNLQRTALLKSIILYRHSVADILLQLGADANLGDIDGLLPLHVCATYSTLSLLQRVIHAGALVNGTDNKGRTALYFAVLSGHHSIVEELLKQGCNVNEGSTMGSPLQTAIVKCRVDSVRSLLMYGANVACAIHEQRALLSKATNCLSLVLIIFHMELVVFGVQNIGPETVLPDRLLKAFQVLELVVQAYGCRFDVSKNIFFLSRQALIIMIIESLKQSSIAQRLKRICKKIRFLQSMHDRRVLPNNMPNIDENVDKNSLENICRIKVRQLFMESKTNVVWAVEKVDCSCVVKDILLLKDI